MLTLANVATSDGYTQACTLGPTATAQQIVFVVANAAVLVQIAPLQPSGTLGDWGDEILLTPQSNVLQRAGGIRFRSAVAGQPAQVVAQLIEPADPAPGAGTPFTGRLAASGAVTPGGSGNVFLTGHFNGAAGIVAGTGYTVVRNALGNYTVTYTTAFAAAPIVVCQLLDSAFHPYFCVIIANGANGFQVACEDSAGGLHDQDVFFLATLGV